MIGIALCVFAVMVQLQGNDEIAWTLGVIGLVIASVEKILTGFDRSRFRADRRP